jgi:hypothetical protein
MNIPHKFTFFNGKSLLKLTHIQGSYYCTMPHVEADTISSAVYDRLNVEHKLHTGKWKIVADLSAAEKEPEMKFPFKFYYHIDPNTSYTIFGKDKGELIINFTDNEYGESDWEIDQALTSRYIKEGIYIVTHVGEQAPSKLDTFNDNKVENFKESTRLSEIVEPVQEFGLSYGTDCAPAENYEVRDSSIQATKISDLTIKITSEGIDETTAKMERLAQATENVTIAFESLQSVMEEMGMSFGGDVNVQTFCCNDQ